MPKIDAFFSERVEVSEQLLRYMQDVVMKRMPFAMPSIQVLLLSLDMDMKMLGVRGDKEDEFDRLLALKKEMERLEASLTKRVRLEPDRKG